MEGLEELSDREEQIKLWWHGNEKNMSSFSEAICAVFDDAGISRAMENGYLCSNFSQQLCQKISALDHAVNLIPENENPQDIINHPRMDNVRLLASELLDLFKAEMGQPPSTSP